MENSLHRLTYLGQIETYLAKKKSLLILNKNYLPDNLCMGDCNTLKDKHTTFWVFIPELNVILHPAC